MCSWHCVITVPPYDDDASSWMVRMSSVWYTEKGRAYHHGHNRGIRTRFGVGTESPCRAMRHAMKTERFMPRQAASANNGSAPLPGSAPLRVMDNQLYP